MKIACIGYRDWAIKIYKDLEKDSSHEYIIQDSLESFNENEIYDFDPDLVLFYGWSNIIDEKILDDFICLMLHPSDLPKFRGGSPIQNQIINGVKMSKITIFRMDHTIDGGDIVCKGDLDLSVDIESIFDQLHKRGFELTKKILENGLSYEKQNDDDASYFKRRKPSESEITIDELLKKPSNYLLDKIRMLQDPYPNAFLRTKDGKKLLIKKADLSD